MADSETIYDVVDYPSGLFPDTHPAHLAAIGRLHGLAPAAPDTARVLEIGGGDGLNLIAMAVACPEGRFTSIDLSRRAVERGQAIVAGSGLLNVDIAQGDIVELATTMEGEFDYIIAHGVYAWVPARVREALLALVGRVLAPQGIAFVSYNAMPGGRLRQVIREMALHEVAGIAGHDERADAARQFIAAYGAAQDDDTPSQAALRGVARPMAKKPIPSLFHDELADVFEPQSLTSIATAAAAHGLAYLNDAGPGGIAGGFRPHPIEEATLLRELQTLDYEQVRFFRSSLFVRADTRRTRRPSAADVADLYLSAECERTGPTSFAWADNAIDVSDVALAEAIDTAHRRSPHRSRVGDLLHDDERHLALFELFAAGVVRLHAAPLTAPANAGEHPLASPLARFQLARGETRISTLAHGGVLLEQAGARHFLSLLDGTRDRAALERDWAASPHGNEVSVDKALARFAGSALLIA